MQLKDKVIVISGASQGLGKELALQIALHKAKVILLARTKSLLQQLQSEIEKENGTADYFVCDIRDQNQVHTISQEIFKRYHHVDILINNAGVWTDDNLEIDQQDLRLKAVETNLLGQIQLTEEFIPRLKSQTNAIIFNVISSAGVSDIPSGNNTHWKTYGATKWGFTGYTQALRESLRDSNIKVIQFFPGGFESNLYENAGRDNPHHQPWMMKTEDVAEIVVFALTRPTDVYMEKIVVTKKM